MLRCFFLANLWDELCIQSQIHLKTNDPHECVATIVTVYNAPFPMVSDRLMRSLGMSWWESDKCLTYSEPILSLLGTHCRCTNTIGNFHVPRFNVAYINLYSGAEVQFCMYYTCNIEPGCISREEKSLGHKNRSQGMNLFSCYSIIDCLFSRGDSL